MTRKLLPYEHQLVDALGITKEEYLDFVAAQPIYQDIKEGTVADIRNAETVAIVLAVVGILGQVASILLAPKPRAPEQQQQQQGVAPSRDQRVMPRFGFNGVQELASYGTSIPLVYTNTTNNHNGGVRVNTSLVWSAVLSYGGNQFMRLLMNVGAGEIEAIDFNRIALGQLPLKDYAQNNVWVYWNPNNHPRFSQLLNSSNTAADPTNNGEGWRASAGLTPFRGGIAEYGFSQALAPSSNNSCSIKSVIPVNVDFDFIEDTGNKVRLDVGTDIVGFSGWAGRSANRGTRLQLRIPNNSQSNPDARQTAVQKIRYAEAAAAFLGGKFKLGGAVFRVTGVRGTSIDFEDIYVDFVCEESGRFPTTGYQSDYLPALQRQESSPLRGIVNISIPAGESVRAGASFPVVNRVGTSGGRSNGTGAVVQALESGGGGPVRFQVINGGNGYRVNDFLYVLTGGTYEVRQQNNRFGSGYQTVQRAFYGSFVAAAENVVLDTEWNARQRAVFFTKCFACIEEAFYATSTKCQSIELALKLTAYRRLSGRSSVYGSNQSRYGYNESENGGIMRTSMFRIYYRLAGSTGWVPVRQIFAFRASNEQSIFTYLKLIRANGDFTAPLPPEYWEIKLVPVIDPTAEDYQAGYCYLIPNAPQQTIEASLGVRIQFNGSVYGPSAIPPLNKTPREISEWDLWNYDSSSQSQFSFEQGPELVITAVNEQLLQPWTDYGWLHQNMATLGVHALASTTTKDLRSVSVWVEKGKKLRPLDFNFNLYTNEAQVTALVNSRPSSSSSYASDIFLDTVLDEENGIGKYASIHSVDVVQLAKTKLFCRTNRLFMDGVIADQRSWREFWSQVAPLCLLELARIGGRDTLVPGVPYDANTGRISLSPLPISALFTPGNILEDSYKEEFIDYGASIQDIDVTVIFRDTERGDIFPRNSTVQVRLNDVRSNDALLETIDASQYVTNRDQAILLGKFLCLSKRYFRRVIEFKTFPTDAPIAPGSYVYVEIGLNKWSTIYSGRVEAGGRLNAPLPQSVPNGTYIGFVYKAGEATRRQFNVTVVDGVASSFAPFEDSLFVLGTLVLDRRVFRVTEVALDEEGETTVRAVEHPTDSSGVSLIAKTLLRDRQFYVDNRLS